MRTGAHIWIGKGLDETVRIIDYLECDCFQIFLHNPRSWERKKRNKKEVVKFKKEIKKRKIFPFVIHMPYLLNLSSSDKKIFKRSVNLFEREIEEAEEYSADYYVIHPGSNPDRKNGIKNLCSVLKNFKSRKIKILVVLETIYVEIWMNSNIFLKRLKILTFALILLMLFNMDIN